MRHHLSFGKLLGLSILLIPLGCGQKVQLSTGVKTSDINKAAAAEDSLGDAEAQADTPSPDLAEAPEKTADNTLPTEAVAPISVGGAHLLCDLTSEADTLACYIEDPSNAKALSLSNDLGITWAVKDAPAGANLSFTTKTLADQSSLYLVKLIGAKTGILQMSVSNTSTTQEFSFDMGTLETPQPLGVTSKSVPSTLPQDNLLRSLPLDNTFSMGDGGFAQEDPACANAASRTQSRKTLAYKVTVGQDLKNISLFMSDICGLSSTTARVSLKGDNFLVVFSLSAGANALKLIEGMNLGPGTYTLTVENSIRQTSTGEIDDFSFGSLHFFGSGAEADDDGSGLLNVSLAL